MEGDWKRDWLWISLLFFNLMMTAGREGEGERDCTVIEVSSIPCVCIYPISDKQSNKGLSLRLLLCLYALYPWHYASLFTQIPMVGHLLI